MSGSGKDRPAKNGGNPKNESRKARRIGAWAILGVGAIGSSASFTAAASQAIAVNQHLKPPSSSVVTQLGIDDRLAVVRAKLQAALDDHRVQQLAEFGTMLSLATAIGGAKLVGKERALVASQNAPTQPAENSKTSAVVGAPSAGRRNRISSETITAGIVAATGVAASVGGLAGVVHFGASVDAHLTQPFAVSEQEVGPEQHLARLEGRLHNAENAHDGEVASGIATYVIASFTAGAAHAYGRRSAEDTVRLEKGDGLNSSSGPDPEPPGLI